MNRIKGFTCLDESNPAAWPDGHATNEHGSRYAGFVPREGADGESQHRPATVPSASAGGATDPTHRFEMT